MHASVQLNILVSYSCIPSSNFHQNIIGCFCFLSEKANGKSDPVLEFYNNLWGLGTEKEWGSYRPTRARIFLLLRSSRIDSKESIPPAYSI